MADLQKLAILIADVGGYDVASDLLGIDEKTLAYAVEGGQLDRRTNALIDVALGNLEINDNELIDFDRIDALTDDLKTLELFTGDDTRANQVRDLVANGVITLEDLQDNYGLFADLTAAHQNRVLEFLLETQDSEAAQAMFSAYELDSEDGEFWDIHDSAFWAWFRDTFYSEQD